MLATWVLRPSLSRPSTFSFKGGEAARWFNGLLDRLDRLGFPWPPAGVTVVGCRLPHGPWWAMAFSWLVLYTFCGLILGGAAGCAGLQQP